MARRMLRYALTAGIAFGLAAWAVTAFGAGGQLVKLPDGRRIYLHCTGHGSPTVLFESGYRGSSGGWIDIQPAVAKTTRACAYDRAGYGSSDPGPLPRDGAAVVSDLDAALSAAHIDGPFVMVGHSAGGLYVRLFADQRPKDVAGMVLVDPSVEHQDQRFEAAFGAGVGDTAPLRARAERCYEAALAGLLPSTAQGVAQCTPHTHPGRMGGLWKQPASEDSQPPYWLTAVSELDTLWTTTTDEIDHGRASYGSLPLIVLTADGTAAEGPPAIRDAAEAFWRRLHQEVAARSSRGQERLVAHSSHNMMRDQPGAVIGAINEVVAAARAAPAGP